MTSSLRNKIIKTTNKCFWCGYVGPKSEFDADHVTPKSLGGIDHESNLVPACSHCNRSRGAKPANESATWIASSKYFHQTQAQRDADMLAIMANILNRKGN